MSNEITVVDPFMREIIEGMSSIEQLDCFYDYVADDYSYPLTDPDHYPLRDDAPPRVKRFFEEWRRMKLDDEAMGIIRD